MEPQPETLFSKMAWEKLVTERNSLTDQLTTANQRIADMGKLLVQFKAHTADADAEAARYYAELQDAQAAIRALARLLTEG